MKTMDFSGRVRSLKSFFTGIPYTKPIDLGYETSSDGLYNYEYKDKKDQLQANLGWVFAANTAIADNCSKVPFILLRNMPDGDQEQVYDHEILDLLNNPNMFMTARQLWNLYYQYLNLTGEAYILKLDKDGSPLTDTRKLPSALFPLPSHMCSFNYEGKSSYDEITINFNGIEYPVTAILRDINPDPENPYVGVSIVRKSALTVDTDVQMKQWNNKLFKNGARPGIVVEVPDQLKDDAYKRLKQQFDEQYKGAGNAFNRVILEGGAKISPFMMSQQDLDFLESKRFTRDEILAMFKVSASNLGITEDVNRANAEAQKAQFTERCVVPRLDQAVDMLNQRLIYPIYGNEYELSYENPVPEDQEMKLKEAQAGVNSWLTIDEVRETYGLEPLADGLGKELYVPISSIPISEVSIGAETSSPEPSGATEEPQDGGQSENEGEGTSQSLSEPHSEEEQAKKEQEKRNKLGEAKVRAYTARSARYERLVLRKARKMFNQQRKEVLAWLENNLGKKGLLEQKDWASDMVDWDEYNSSFSKDLQRILTMIIDEVGQEAFNALVEGEFDPRTEAIIQYIKDTADLNAMSINAETEKQIRATLAQGIRNNETTQQLQSRVNQVFGTASTNRAWLIAQTECALAQNYADVEAWKQTEVVEAKEWFTAEDEKVCGWCADMDGKILALDENFFDKGDRFVFTDAHDHQHSMNLDYRSIGEPPLHPGCRCVLLPVLK